MLPNYGQKTEFIIMQILKQNKKIKEVVLCARLLLAIFNIKGFKIVEKLIYSNTTFETGANTRLKLISGHQIPIHNYSLY